MDWAKSAPKRILKTMDKWLQRQWPRDDAASAKKRFQDCVDWMANLDNYEDVEGDTAISSGPLQGYPRILFPMIYNRFLRKRRRLAIQRGTWDQATWDAWCRHRRPWEAIDDLRWGWSAGRAEEKSDSEKSSDSEGEEEESGETEKWENWWWCSTATWSYCDSRSGGGGASYSSWGNAAGASGHATTSWGSACSNMRSRSPRQAWHRAAEEDTVVPEPEPVVLVVPTAPDGRFLADDPNATTKVNRMMRSTEFLRKVDAPARFKPTDDAWKRAVGDKKDQWNIRDDGTFPWNSAEQKVLKHAYRITGVGHVRWVYAMKSKELYNLATKDGFNLGRLGDNADQGLSELLTWMSQRPAMMEQIDSIRMDIDRRSGLSESLRETGQFYYFKLRGGKDPELDTPMPKYEFGFHATSMYCLNSIVQKGDLSPGPGQLSVTAKEPAVYYHRRHRSHLCSDSYNHYVGLGSGPWLFAPVLVLEAVNADLDLDRFNGRKTNANGQRMTYRGLHSVVGFAVHVMHIMELRWGAHPSFCAIVEASWKGILEVPANLSWEELVKRAHDMDKRLGL